MISHDRRFLANLSRATVWLDRGADAPDRARLRRLRGLARRGAGRGGARPAQARPQDRRRGALAALRRHRRGASATSAGSATCRRCAQARRDYRAAAGKAALAAAAADRSGTLVIEADGIGKSYDGRPIVADFSTRIQRGDRIGIVGPNGSGKTTLINLLTGALAPDTGTVRLGANLAMATLDQHRESLDPDATLARGADRRARRHRHGRRPAAARDRLHEGLPVRARAGAHAARRALGRRARPPDAGARAGQAVERAGARRADQRSRSRNARRAGGDARRLCRHRPAHQPRPRFPRPRGQRRDRARGRRPLGGICRRLFRHAGAARRRPRARAGEAGGTEGAEEAKARAGASRSRRKRRLSFNEKHALETLPKTIAALQAKDRALHDRVSTIPASMRATARPSTTTSAALAAAQAELAAAEERWLELEMLREELAGG